MEDIKKFITTLMIAISNCSLYSKNHESVDEYSRKAHRAITDVLNESLEVMMIANDLIINKAPLRDPGPQGINLMKRMKRHKIMRIDILKGVSQSEIRQFIVDMAGSEGAVKTYAHIKTGVVDIRAKGLEIEESVDLSDIPSFNAAQIEKVKDCLNHHSPFKKLHIAGLEEIVTSYIITFRKEANLLKLLSPVRTHSEYTYTHGTNVAILSMSQVDFLGLGDELLHNVGIAALLHDAGKLFISNEILEKEGALSEEEFREISYHTLYGARYLAGIERITPLAPIVALEHHMKYDGSGYPKNGNGKKQHICSQIVALADFFDAMRSHRPYRKSWEIDEVLALMKKNAGSDFNPFLVDNFIRILKDANVQ